MFVSSTQFVGSVLVPFAFESSNKVSVGLKLDRQSEIWDAAPQVPRNTSGCGALAFSLPDAIASILYDTPTTAQKVAVTVSFRLYITRRLHSVLFCKS